MATKFICGFFPRYKLHKACTSDELRPVMSYLCFKNGKVYATDAHIAIAAPLSRVSTFSDEEQKLLEGKLIHAKQFEQLLKMKETKVEHVGEHLCFICTTKEGVPAIIPLFNETARYRFPNVDVVLESAIKDARENKQPVSCVGLNPSMLANLTAAMGAGRVNMYFSSEKKAIVVRDGDEDRIDDEIGAIIMPIIVSNPKF